MCIRLIYQAMKTNRQEMDAKQFFDKVAAMRRYQKDYFRTRSSVALRNSKALEKEIDQEIERVQKIIGEQPKTVEQGNLFK